MASSSSLPFREASSSTADSGGYEPNTGSHLQAAGIETKDTAPSLPTATSDGDTHLQLADQDGVIEETEFDPGRCQFCNRFNTGLDENLEHMRKAHGLFIPDRDHLVVDVETLLAYIHLIIFGYRECLHCGVQRGTVGAVQQHMMAKSHCKFDLQDSDSEFRDFYNFESGVGDEERKQGEGSGEAVKEDTESGEPGSRAKYGETEQDIELDSESAKATGSQFIQVDDMTIRLPSGKLISNGLSRNSKSMAARTSPNRRSPKPGLATWKETSGGPQSELDSSIPTQPGLNPTSSSSSAAATASVAMTKSEKRNLAFATGQLAKLRAEDRRSLANLSVPQLRALLSKQKRQIDKAMRAERAMQGRVQTMGNKTLMMHFVSDVPGRFNG